MQTLAEIQINELPSFGPLMSLDASHTALRGGISFRFSQVSFVSSAPYVRRSVGCRETVVENWRRRCTP